MLKDKILALRSEGKSYNEISKELGCAKSTVAYHCSDGQTEKSLRRQTQRRNKIRRHIFEIKSNTPCADCGIKYPYYVMDFDHRPEEVKLFTISEVFKYKTLEATKAEIIKCDVVCSNCHRERTYRRSLKAA